MRVLVLGGTRFLGRAVVDAAVAAGHQVTVFNRGRTNPGLYDRSVVDLVIGDREVDLSPLDGRTFDVVVDVAGYAPEVVRRSAAAVADRTGRYVFVSTASVYVDHSVRQIEGAEVLRLSEHTPAGLRYGAAKAACEAIVEELYGDRAFIVRPGLIVGPHDPTDRFAYWPRRMVRGGTVLAPGGPEDPLQFVDVRDLGGFIVAGAADGIDGVYNVAGPPIGFGSLLRACQQVTGFQGELIWVDSGRLLAAGADPWMGVPLWIAEPGWEAANDVDTTRAQAAGLSIRPVARTLADVLAWDQARGGPEREGLAAAEEVRLLTHQVI